MIKPATIATPADEILGLYFPVLDNGFVSLVDYMGSDESIERAARVSYGAGTRQTSDTRNLIRYLKRHKHTSPFEQAEMVFHMALPIFVARQLVRTRTASLNEYSGRYSEMPLVYYTPSEENYRAQSASNRQGRDQDEEFHFYDDAVEGMDEVRSAADEVYTRRLEEGAARELARIDLPLSIYTQWYFKMDLHNLMHLLTLRCDSHAQWEVQQYANIMAGMFQLVAPLSFEAWVDYQYSAVTFSAQEMEAIQHGWRTGKGDGHEVAGLKGRELQEYKDKTSQPLTKPSFVLDRSKAQTAEFYAAKFAAAVPK